MPHSFAHLPTEFIGFHSKPNAAPDAKINDFFKKLGAPNTAWEYHPLLLSTDLQYTTIVMHSFGLFVKDNMLFEVRGSECSAWEFDGQWDPQPTSTAQIWDHVNRGTLGSYFPQHSFYSSLCSILEWVDSAIEKHVILNALAQNANIHPAPKKI